MYMYIQKASFECVCVELYNKCTRISLLTFGFNHVVLSVIAVLFLNKDTQLLSCICCYRQTLSTSIECY